MLQADVLAALFAFWALREPEQQPILSAALTMFMKVREIFAPTYRKHLNAASMAWDYYEFLSTLQADVIFVGEAWPVTGRALKTKKESYKCRGKTSSSREMPPP